MNINKLAAASSILIGIVFIVIGAGMIYAMMQISSVLTLFTSNPLMGAVGTMMNNFMSPYMIFGWIFGILAFIAGIVSIITGAAYLMQKEE